VAEEVLLIEKRDGVATLTLNRPRAMNALSGELLRALADALEQLGDDSEIGAVILTGAGEDAFCAGLDLKELAGESGQADAAPRRFEVSRLESFDRPVIGAINGVAITGGFELALACDVLVGSTRARFADTHARVGILPGWGLSQKLARLVGVYRAKELSLTGNFIDAGQAERWGLLNRVVEPDVLMETCRALARDMLSCQPELVKAYKGVIDRGFAATLAEGRAMETELNREQRKGVSQQDLAAARKRVTARGREQSR
jgi:enoyl-CoA hydratase